MPSVLSCFQLTKSNDKHVGGFLQNPRALSIFLARLITFGKSVWVS